MSRMNRRRFTWVATSGVASVALVACGSDAVDEDLTPTRIADVEGAPPTLAPNATPFASDDAGEESGGGEAQGDGGDAGGEGGAGEAITIEAQDPFNWSTYELEAAPGQEITVVNAGSLQHDFVIDEWDIATDLLNGGDEATVTVPEDAEVGTEVVYYCSVPGHRESGMEGTLTVVEAGAAGGGEEEAPAEEEEGAAAGGAGEAVTIEAQDPFNWSTYELEAAPGQEITVVNAGSLQHDFVIDEWEVATDLLNGGDQATVTVPEDAEVGTEVVYYCSVPGHRESGMEGTLTVVEGGGAAAAGSAEEEEPAEEDAAAEEGAAAGGAGEPITIEAQDPFNWSTYEIEAAPGQEITVVNTGSLQHDFVIDEWEIATDLLNNSEEATVTVPEDAEVGTEVVYYCSVPGHRESGMEGTLTVVEGGGGAAEEAPAEEEETEEPEEQAAAVGPVDPSETITVEALDSLAYEPSEIAVAPGQAILVRNVGSLQHDFVVDEWGLATSLLNGGTEEEFIVPGNAEVGQSYTFYCSVPGHQAAGMQGTLTVAEASGAAATPEEAAEEQTPEEEAAPEQEEGAAIELDPNAIRVAALDSMRFAPAQFSAAPGQQIHLVNTGVLVHDIVIDEWGIDTGAIGGGEETTFNIPDDAEVGSEVHYYCSVPGHLESGMEGFITIVEADSRVAGLATPAPESTPAGEATPAAVGTPISEDATPVATAAEGEEAAGSGGSDSAAVIAVDIAFEPTEFSIAADTDVEITVTNEGVLQHDFVIEDTDFATELLDGGSEATITVNLPAGEYVYFCSVPGHREAGMEGVLTAE